MLILNNFSEHRKLFKIHFAIKLYLDIHVITLEKWYCEDQLFRSKIRFNLMKNYENLESYFSLFLIDFELDTGLRL